MTRSSVLIYLELTLYFLDAIDHDLYDSDRFLDSLLTYWED